MIKTYSKQTFDEYYIDDKTTNTSFIRMAILLNAKGIKNWNFFLKLYNKKLQGVNPFSHKLSDEKKLMVLKECRDNRWYFYREVFRVVAEGMNTDVGGGLAFGLHRGNLAYLWANELNLSTYMILPRQFGKTWSAIADATWTHQFNKNTSIVHFNKSQSDSNSNIYRIKQAIAMLPLYMQHSSDDNLNTKDKRKVKDNEKSLRNILSSTIIAMASAGNEAKADAAARGKTAAKLWFDEFAFLFFNQAIFEATSPVFDKASEAAIDAGVPYGISITTTPGDLATPHGEYAYKFMQESITFDESMYDDKIKKLYNYINNNQSRRPFIFIQFSYLQLGKDDEWFAKVSKKMGNYLKSRREYLLEWINSNGNSPFDQDDLDVIIDLAKSREDSRETITINKYFTFSVYNEYRGRKPVLISVDVAAGLGRDSTAIVVIHPENLKPIAIFKSNMINLNHAKKLLIKLITNHYPNAVLTIENNSIGHGLIEELKDSPIARCLYRERKKRTIDNGVGKFTRTRKIDTIEYGHNTNTDSRAKMMEILESMAKYSKGHLGFPEISDEMKFLEIRNGRIGHGSSTHDDVIMAYMGGLYVVRYGTGLKNKGIYFNIAESDEDETYYLDDIDYSKVDKAIFNQDDDDYIRFMTTEQPVNTAKTLMTKEHERFLKFTDKQNGVYDEEDDYGTIQISENIDRMIMQNNFSILTGEDDFGEIRFADSYNEEDSLYDSLIHTGNTIW